MDRNEAIIKLHDIIVNGNRDTNLIKEVERAILGTTLSHGCSCKISSVISRLNQFWHTSGLTEYNNINNNG